MSSLPTASIEHAVAIAPWGNPEAAHNAYGVNTIPSSPTSPVSLFLRPFSISVLTRNSSHLDERRFPPISASLLPLTGPNTPLSKSFSSNSEPELLEDEQDEESVSLASPSDINDEDESNEGEDGGVASKREESESREERIEIPALKLSVKEKKKLSSYAHSLGDKLKCQLVGKLGLTDSAVFSILETLEKNELLKLKLHKTCPGELEDMILRLEEATGSVPVGRIARTVILYRPSPTKLKAEEKKTTQTR